MMGDEYIDDLAAATGADDVVAALAETVAATPPGDVRARLLEIVAKRPRPTLPVASPAETYAARVDAMDALLRELGADDWAQRARPYDWSVHELLAHLTVIEAYTARQLGLTDEAPLPLAAASTLDHLAFDAAGAAALVRDDPSATVERWRTFARRICTHVRGDTFDPRSPVPLHQWAFDGATALIARSFEIWTHADDIRRATGRSLDVPSAAELRAMSSASVGGLPILLAVTDGPPMRPTRIVLTGVGGGTFDLGRNGVNEFENLLVADVVDYCRVVAQRIAPAELTQHREGDHALLDGLLQAAGAIAL